jgi:hypothetical protein
MRSRHADDLDSPWKEALDFFLPQFLAFFFAAIYDAIDWSRRYESLDKELQKLAPDAGVGKRLADKLFKVWLKDGQEAWLLIHIEVQGRREKRFAERMFTYSYRIYDRYHKPVLSMAVLCDADPAWKPDHFGYNMWGCELSLRFLVAKLIELKGQEQRLETDANPFAAIVLAQLKAIDTKHSPTERHLWKLRLIKGLYDRGLNKEAIRQLFRLIDWMLTLPEELDEAFWQEIQIFEEERRMPYVTSVERLALKKGREEGLVVGHEKGLYEGLLEGIELALKAKYDAFDKRLWKEIQSLKELGQLREIKKLIEKAATAEELRKLIRK